MNPSAPVLSTDTLMDALRAVDDPEFGISIVELGLIYRIETESGRVRVTMTLTSMYCPAGDVILGGVQAALEQTPGVSEVQVDLVWDPTWTPDRLTPAARAQLGWDEPQVDE